MNVEKGKPRTRETGLLFCAIGLVALGSSVFYEPAREVLIGVAAIGFFGGVLLVAITPERFVTTSIAESIHTAHIHNQESITAELGVSGSQIYVPTESEVRLAFTNTDENLPRITDDTETVVLSDGKIDAMVVEPTGARLFDSVAHDGEPFPTAPEEVFHVVSEAAQIQFGIADSVEMTGSGDGSITIAAETSILSTSTGIDSLLVSLFAVGFATGLDRPVRVTRATTEDADYLVTFRWRVK